MKNQLLLAFLILIIPYATMAKKKQVAAAPAKVVDACLPLEEISIDDKGNNRAAAMAGDYEMNLDKEVVYSIQNKKTNQACEASTARVSRIHQFAKKNLALIQSGDISNGYVEIMNLDNCHSAWKVTALKARVFRDRIETDAYCECRNGPEECHCFAARVLRFNATCEPIENEDDSMIKTQKMLGVVFKRDGWVSKPETPEAKIIAAPRPAK